MFAFEGAFFVKHKIYVKYRLSLCGFGGEGWGGAGGVNLIPPVFPFSFLQKKVFSRGMVKLWFFMTFNIIKITFFLKISQGGQKI